MPFSRAAATVSEPAVLNRDKLQALTLGDPGLQRQLVESFLRQAPSLRQELARSCVHGPRQFADAVHRTKGSCQFVGGDRLHRLLVATEDEEGGTQATRQAALAQILGELEQLEGSLQDLLQEAK